MKAQVAFYKAPGNMRDKLIRLFTWSKYSHVELVIRDRYYSSSVRDGGVRAKYMEIDEDTWEYVDVDIDYMYVEELFRSTEGMKYDYMAIWLSQIIPLGVHSEEKYICSEWVASALKLKDAQKYSPQDVYEYVTRGEGK